MDINKVKSKSRAILNNMKDGEKLDDEDTDLKDKVSSAEFDPDN